MASVGLCARVLLAVWIAALIRPILAEAVPRQPVAQPITGTAVEFWHAMRYRADRPHGLRPVLHLKARSSRGRPPAETPSGVAQMLTRSRRSRPASERPGRSRPEPWRHPRPAGPAGPRRPPAAPSARSPSSHAPAAPVGRQRHSPRPPRGIALEPRPDRRLTTRARRAAPGHPPPRRAYTAGRCFARPPTRAQSPSIPTRGLFTPGSRSPVRPQPPVPPPREILEPRLLLHSTLLQRGSELVSRGGQYHCRSTYRASSCAGDFCVAIRRPCVVRATLFESATAHNAGHQCDQDSRCSPECDQSLCTGLRIPGQLPQRRRFEKPL